MLTSEEVENKKEKKREYSRNSRRSLDGKILPIPAQQIPDVEAEEDNATLKKDGYKGMLLLIHY